MRLRDFDVLTFDCYGTLIDWEGGIAAALRPWARHNGLLLSDDELLAGFAEVESACQAATPDKLYSDLLEDVIRAVAGKWGVTATDDDARAFGASVGDWSAFPDSVDALRYLKQHFKLVIVSNVDRASFAGSNERLGVDFDAIVTAQDVGSYKPDPRNFAALIEAVAVLGIDKERILHTAQSLFHDMVPAKQAGLATMWVNRRKTADGWGATPPPPEAVTPDLEVASLAEVVEIHRAEAGAD